jgi:hypothetical protein
MSLVCLAFGTLALCGGFAEPTVQPQTSLRRKAEADRRLRVQVDTSEITTVIGERSVLRYRYNDVPFKPYVRELYTPGGINVLRDAPPDHLHHHGLMFAVAADGVTFWAETADAGRQLPHTNTGVDVQDDSAGFSGLLPWVIDSRVLLREYRRIDVLRPPAGEPVTLLTWRSQLMPDGNVTLSGNHYFGLGMRFVAAMDRVGTFHNAAGKPGEVFRGDERLVRARWCAYTATVDDKPVTVAMFDDPGNPRHPATWFTMREPFAYLSATMSLHTEPLPLEKGQTLDLWYGVAVWDGQLDTARIERTYIYWLRKSRRPLQNGATEHDIVGPRKRE